MESFNWLVENWGATLGVIAAFVIAFDRLAKLTPTKSDDKIIAGLQSIFTVLGLKVSDRDK